MSTPHTRPVTITSPTHAVGVIMIMTQTAILTLSYMTEGRT